MNHMTIPTNLDHHMNPYSNEAEPIEVWERIDNSEITGIKTESVTHNEHQWQVSFQIKGTVEDGWERVLTVNELIIDINSIDSHTAKTVGINTDRNAYKRIEWNHFLENFFENAFEYPASLNHDVLVLNGMRVLLFK